MHEFRLRPALKVWVLLFTLVWILAGCGTSKKTQVGGYGVGGGDYRRDGPHAKPPANLERVPDAIPRIEPLASGPNKPYVIMGKRYVPDTSGNPYRVRGKASWYGRQFHGRPTSSGEAYDMYAMTAAHPTLPIPSYARVTRVDNGRSVIVRINDRGPFIDSRVIDLSYVAAYKLDTIAHGTGDVVVERIMPQEIRTASYQRGTTAASAAAVPAAAPVSVASAAPAPQATLLPASQRAPANASAITAPPDTHDEVQALLASSGAARLAIPVPSAPASESRNHARASHPTVPAFLQLGAFGEAHNAHQLANRIRASLRSYGEIDVVETADRVYRVRLGPFQDRNTAVVHVDAIYSQTGIRPHVTSQ